VQLTIFVVCVTFVCSSIDTATVIACSNVSFWFNTEFCSAFRTHLCEWYAMQYNTTVHLNYFGKRCIVCQLSNEFTTRLQWRQKASSSATTVSMGINDHLPAQSLRSTNKVLRTIPAAKPESAAKHMEQSTHHSQHSNINSPTQLLLKGHLFSHAMATRRPLVIMTDDDYGAIYKSQWYWHLLV